MKMEKVLALAVVKPVAKYFLCYLFISILVHQGKGYQNSYWTMGKLFYFFFVENKGFLESRLL